MNILSRPFRAGKTYECIRASAETGAIIICADEGEASRVKIEAHYMRVKIPDPIPCHGALERLRGQHVPVIVDNMDWVLKQFLGADVLAGTVNGPSAAIEWPSTLNES